MQIQIEASILSADLARLGAQAQEAQRAGVDGLQIDIMDGRFVPNITFGPNVVRSLRPLVKIMLDVHLMVDEPEKILGEFIRAGADRIIIHKEACRHLYRTLQQIKDAGIQAGIAINPETPLSALEEVLGIADVIQIMTVSPGFGGQEFIGTQLKKIQDLSWILEQRGEKKMIAVDGGITPRTAPLAVRMGANVLVSGSAIFNRSSVARNVAALRKSVQAPTPKRSRKTSA